MSAFLPDSIIVSAGLAGMAAAYEAVLRSRRVLLLDQEGPQSLGGQAFWSLGEWFMVGSPEQRRLGIKDSAELAWHDWYAVLPRCGLGRAWRRAGRLAWQHRAAFLQHMGDGHGDGQTLR